MAVQDRRYSSQPFAERHLPEGGRTGQIVETGFRLAARVRRARAFHPQGSMWTGDFEVTHPLGGDHVFSEPGTYPALVRFSFGAGLPRPIPDFHGIALRLEDVYGPDRPQDVLLVSSLAPPLLRHLLVPVPRGHRFVHSSVLPYSLGRRRRVLFSARYDEAVPRDGHGAGPFRLSTASPGGRWQERGRFRLGSACGDQAERVVHFDPWNTGAGLEPSGFLNALRRTSYRGSRAGRGADRGRAAGVAALEAREGAPGE